MWCFVNDLRDNNSGNSKGTGLDFESAKQIFTEKFHKALGNSKLSSPMSSMRSSVNIGDAFSQAHNLVMSPVSVYRGSGNIIKPVSIKSPLSSQNNLKVITRLTRVNEHTRTPISSRGTMFSPNIGQSRASIVSPVDSPTYP
jgi:hypothetical protein